MAKRIDPKSVARSKQLPTTGNGVTGGQKPKLSETNLGSKKPGFIARLLTRASESHKSTGKHGK